MEIVQTGNVNHVWITVYFVLIPRIVNSVSMATTSQSVWIVHVSAKLSSCMGLLPIYQDLLPISPKSHP